MKRVLYGAAGLLFAVSSVWAEDAAGKKDAAGKEDAAGKKAVKGEHAVKLADPAGDVRPISSSGGRKFPGLDVVELALSSDGSELTVTATLKEKVEKFASTAVEMHIDTDNNMGTGGRSMFLDVGGFERRVDLNACLEYADGSSACIGAFGEAVKSSYAVATVERYTGKDSNTERVVGGFNVPRVPSDGKVIQARVKYTDLGARPGQTLRIVAREVSAGPEIEAYFPDVLLTLK